MQQNYSNGVTSLKQKENSLNINLELLKKKKTAINSINKVLSNSREKLSKIKLQIKQQNNVLDQENKQLCLWEEQVMNSIHYDIIIYKTENEMN